MMNKILMAVLTIAISSVLIPGKAHALGVGCIDPMAVFVGVLVFLVGAYAVTMLLLGIGLFCKRVYNDVQTIDKGRFISFTLIPFGIVLFIIIVMILGGLLWEVVRATSKYF